MPIVLKKYVEYKDDGRVQQIGAALTHEQEKPGETAPLDESRRDPDPEGDQPLQNPNSKGEKQRAEEKAVEEKEKVFVEETVDTRFERV